MIVLALAAATAASAGKDGIYDARVPSYYTGDDLLTMHCSSPPRSPNYAVCQAYIVGAVDMVRATRIEPHVRSAFLSTCLKARLLRRSSGGFGGTKPTDVTRPLSRFEAR